MTVAALAHVWVQLAMLVDRLRHSRETKWRHDLGEQNQRLTLELRTRMDLAVVERVARDELKMVPPDPRMIRVVKPSGRGDDERRRSTRRRAG